MAAQAALGMASGVIGMIKALGKLSMQAQDEIGEKDG